MIHIEVVASDAGGQKVRLLPVGGLLPRETRAQPVSLVMGRSDVSRN